MEVKKRTLRSFGYEWRKFSEAHEEYKRELLHVLRPVKPSFFKNKLVLDAGCGAGRLTYYMAKTGCELVGIDLSKAVYSAHENMKGFSNVHIMQADIYNLPLRPCFDFVYSIGVIHHLPKPELGIKRLSALLKPNSTLFVWVYGREDNFFAVVVLDRIRKVTTKLPLGLLYQLCYFPAAILHVLNLLFQMLSKTPLTKALADRLPYSQYSHVRFRKKHLTVFDHLSVPVARFFTKEEVVKMFNDAGLEIQSISRISRKELQQNSWRVLGIPNVPKG